MYAALVSYLFYSSRVKYGADNGSDEFMMCYGTSSKFSTNPSAVQQLQEPPPQLIQAGIAYSTR